MSQILRNLFSKVGSGDKPYVLSVQLSSQLLSSVVTYICNTHENVQALRNSRYMYVGLKDSVVGSSSLLCPAP